MKKILVLGGTGFVGRHLCQALARLNYEVTVPTRDRSLAAGGGSLPGSKLVAADIHDEAALTGVIRGHDAVVNLVAILHGSAFEFERIHVGLVKKIVSACAAAGVARLIHVSALGAGADAPSMYQRSKAAGEEVIRASALDWTVVRPSVIFGEGDQFLSLFARLQGLLPVMLLAGADTLFQPVWVQDVVQAIVACLQRDDTATKVYEACGPERFSLRQLVQMAGRWSGHVRPVIGLPAPVARIQALLMELAPGPTLMSRDNLDSLKVDNVASGTLPGLQGLGITPSALSAIAPGYLGPQR